ncbi:MAG: hypothetical protein A2017_12975 [Lentisphaerae bacterium GWF2_44_16]|nr:MAG: hypothetical protein A2017_12975 [Lentisphaerae bacterium GWF2_44_16]
MNVIALYNKYSGINEIVDGFKKTNKEVLLFGSAEEFNAIYSRHVIEFVMDINFHPEVRDICVKNGLSYMLWNFNPDAAAMISSFTAPMRGNDFIFLNNKDDYNECSRKYGNIFYLPLSTTDSFIMTPRYSGFENQILIIVKNNEREIAAEKSFQKIIAEQKDERHLKNYRLIKSLASACLEKHKYIFDKNIFPELLQKSIDDCGMDPFDEEDRDLFLDHYIRTLSSIQKELCINEICLTGHKVCFYGDRSYEKMLKLYKDTEFHTLEECKEVHKLYNSSKINIILTEIQNVGAIPKDVFNMLAAGAFVLSTHSSEIASVFKVGNHLETFADAKELIDKIHLYMSNDSMRQRIASSGQAEFQNFHSMSSRLSYICMQRFNKKPAIVIDRKQ